MRKKPLLPSNTGASAMAGMKPPPMPTPFGPVPAHVKSEAMHEAQAAAHRTMANHFRSKDKKRSF